MENTSSKLILRLIFVIIILGCIFIFKVLNGNKKVNTSKSNYSKTEIINLIKSEDNKSNYEVEYTTNNINFKKKYFNKKMKFEASNNESNILSYLDFEKNTNTLIDEKNKIAIIQKLGSTNKNYIPNDLLNIIEDPNCIIEKEEKVLNRNAVVLDYNGTEEKQNYNMKNWIDTETGFLLQTIVKANNTEQKIIYNLKLNSVTEEDVSVPNLSQYKVTDITSKR